MNTDLLIEASLLSLLPTSNLPWRNRTTVFWSPNHLLKNSLSIRSKFWIFYTIDRNKSNACIGFINWLCSKLAVEMRTCNESSDSNIVNFVWCVPNGIGSDAFPTVTFSNFRFRTCNFPGKLITGSKRRIESNLIEKPVIFRSHLWANHQSDGRLGYLCRVLPASETDSAYST